MLLRKMFLRKMFLRKMLLREVFLNTNLSHKTNYSQFLDNIGLIVGIPCATQAEWCQTCTNYSLRDKGFSQTLAAKNI